MTERRSNPLLARRVAPRLIVVAFATLLIILIAAVGSFRYGLLDGWDTWEPSTTDCDVIEETLRDQYQQPMLINAGNDDYGNLRRCDWRTSSDFQFQFDSGSWRPGSPMVVVVTAGRPKYNLRKSRAVVPNGNVVPGTRIGRGQECTLVRNDNSWKVITCRDTLIL